MTEEEEASLTPEEIVTIKSDMVDLAARLERLAMRLQAPARLNIPAEPERGRKGDRR